MRRFVFRVEIEEGSDEFWEDIEARGVTGCDEVLAAVRQALGSHGFLQDYGTAVTLEEYSCGRERLDRIGRRA